ncbi:MAG: carbohydrate-binding protein [Thermincolia bacterium]
MVDFKHTNFRDGEQRLPQMQKAQFEGGVAVDPTPITLGQEVTVLYEGILADSGADQVFLHCGYGSNENWQMIQDLPMYHTGHGWERSFKVNDESRLNFCFKDSANNWDNNSGHNWSFEVHNGR